jgi:hypothetical protein
VAGFNVDDFMCVKCRDSRDEVCMDCTNWEGLKCAAIFLFAPLFR